MPSSTKRALIVDDEFISRKVVHHALAQKGFDCNWAEDGEDALRRISQHSYDVVVTDLLMPKMNGGELVIHLCHLPSPPVVVVHTSVLEQEVIDGLKREGVDEILFKPADYLQMADRVESILQKRKQRPKVSWRQWLTTRQSNPVLRWFDAGDEWIQSTVSRRETFRFGMIILACLLFGLGWGSTLNAHMSVLCRWFSLCGLAFYFCLELVAYYRDQNHAMLVRYVAERRLCREQGHARADNAAVADQRVSLPVTTN